jgi:hypothetical protein
VGLEFGIHGFQPYRTDQVWVRRFGDCKDQATLLVTLLESAGIPAHLVLVRSRPLGRLDDALPALGLFDHVIVWLPESHRFVDTTDRTIGFGVLPSSDVGAQALILDPARSGKLTRVPVPAAAQNSIEAEYSVILRGDGRGTIDGRIRFRGIRASTFRKRFTNKSLRVQQIARLVNGRYPGARLNSHSLSDPSQLGRPLELTFSAHAPGVAQRAGQRARILRPIGGDGLASIFAPRAKRKHAISLGVPARYRFRFSYILPPGWELEDMPVSGKEEAPFGRYEIRWHKEVGAIRGELLFQLNQDQVEGADYPAFYKFMQRFDAAIRPALRLKIKGEGGV